MHPLVYLSVLLATFGLASYGVQLTPLEAQPKQVAQFGIVVVFLAVLARHYGVL